MQRKLISTAAVTSLIGASLAWAQPPAKPNEPQDMQRHFAQMCTDQYPVAAGEVAFLEAKLALTDKQKSLFERWKAVKLANAKARAADCPAIRQHDKPPSAIDRMKMEQRMLQARLDDIRSQLPALESLLNSLTDEQKDALDQGTMMEGHGPRILMIRQGGQPMPPPDELPPPRP
jgi:periplasmic protein CpxP/Spy